MKIQLNKNRGSAFIILLIIMLVVGMWIVTLSEITSSTSVNEGRRASLAMAVATADAGLARALGRWNNFTANGATLPTPSEIATNWTDSQRAPTYTLNEGVEMTAADVSLRYMDGLGRVYKESVSDSDIESDMQTYDTGYGKPAKRLSLIATARARVNNPIGDSDETISVEVNRVYNRNSYPWPEGLAQHMHAGDPTTLMLHAGPPMTLDGPLYSSKLILGMTNSDTYVFGDVITPPNFPAKSADGGALSDAAIFQQLTDLVDEERYDEIEGFFYNGERRQGSDSPFRPNQKNGIHVNFDDPADDHYVTHQQRDESKYLFDTNDAEYWTYFGDTDGDGRSDHAFRDSSNPNIVDGYRELIERRDPNYDESLFLASKRLYNKADLKIIYDSSAENFLLTDEDDEVILDDDGYPEINPDAIQIFYKDKDPNNPPTVGELPPNPTASEISAWESEAEDAIAWHESKAEVPDYLKTAILKTMRFKEENFQDKWILGNDASFDGMMDILNFDMAKLGDVLEAWTNGNDPDETIFGGNYNSGDFVYLPNQDTSDEYRGYTLYVTDEASNYDMSGGSPEFHKGIRLRNGTHIPKGGVVIATDLIAYVEGDYNTGGTGNAIESNDINDDDHTDEQNHVDGYNPDTRPSAVWADAIRLLSSRWDDADSTGDLSDRRARHTTYNLSMIMGDFSENDDGTDTGGLHNFPRFLEKWSNKDATIYGGMVRLWMSHSTLKGYDDVPWSGNYYSPPDRHWSYDRSYLRNGGPPDGPGKTDSSYGRYWFTTGI